jgi:hypothetical protein
VSSIEPDDGSGEVDRGQEVGGPLIVTGRDSPVLFELGEEVLDEMTRFIQDLVVRARVLAIGLGRDHRFFARLLQRGENPSLGVERLVRDQDTGLNFRQQGIRPFQVVRLPRREREPGRVAERVDQGVDLGAQAASAAPDRLLAAAFLIAPALC